MSDDQVKIKKQSNDFEGSICCSDDAHYPYGTSLSFDNDMIDELGMGSLAVGDVVEVRGFAFVDRKNEHSNTEGSEKNINLQLTTVQIRRETDDRVKQLYGSDS